MATAYSKVISPTCLRCEVAAWRSQRGYLPSLPYGLLPREPAATFCWQTIERLPLQYDAPVFVPHLAVGGEYDPHLGLLYHDLPAEEKTRLATSLKLPFPIAEFDRLVAVRCADPTMTRADIEAWQMMPWGV